MWIKRKHPNANKYIWEYQYIIPDWTPDWFEASIIELFPMEELWEILIKKEDWTQESYWFDTLEEAKKYYSDNH